MKKLLIIMTLFMSSFFLFSLEDVKAADYSYDFSDYSYLINDTYYLVKEKAQSYLESMSSSYDKYLIYYNLSDSYYYFALLEIDSGDYPLISLMSDRFNVDCSYVAAYRYKTNDGISISNAGNLASLGSLFFPSYIHLYSSSNIPIYSVYDNLTLKMNDYSYNILSSNDFLFLEDLYNLSLGIEEENPHQEEIDKVTNFYNMVIEKIGYFAEQIANNHILLFVIGIFIVIFIFLLIFRRFIC